MIHFIKSIIFFCIFLSVQTVQAETPEQKALDAVQKNYEKVLTFEAEFIQKSYVKMMDKTQDAKGTVSIKKPGKMKWTYGAPDTQVLISNGKTLWHYVEDEEQVTKVPIESIYSSNTPALFLAGKGKLTQTFNIESVSLETNPISITLTPREDDQALTRLQLFANKKNYQITGSTVYDKLGNKTEIHFSKIKTNTEIPEKTFQFQAPPDVEVLDYTKNP
ncbi:MAG: outer membrane lipoprotein chaperone LolA [Nitrospinae bacterium]|nr:outer membrane lipoprotein chaperone LolA [Nitrospinota bacterium]MZH05430.1 outer membrane lipoprotein chaperone LolA [Nitrospinota bacterium]MZH13292.1 outer membrane lipoprotein chaperone LolA [Nitrospinota bacterium]